jgi:hypothetical protein
VPVVVPLLLALDGAAPASGVLLAAGSAVRLGVAQSALARGDASIRLVSNMEESKTGVVMARIPV